MVVGARLLFLSLQFGLGDGWMRGGWVGRCKVKWRLESAEGGDSLMSAEVIELNTHTHTGQTRGCRLLLLSNDLMQF